jgi:hypothetical protein
MKEKTKIYIFHVNRKGGKPVFFHPFPNTQEFINQVKDSVIIGKYGEDPRVESITLLRNDLYRRAETAIKLWITDVRFIPRFLISSAVFLGVYFFMSYVIRDPLPLIDEVIGASGGAAAVYIFLGRKYLNSEAVVQKRIELRTAIDGVSFTESEMLKKVEALLSAYDEAPLAELFTAYGTQEKLVLNSEWHEEARNLLRYLETQFDTKTVKSFMKKIQNRVTSEIEKPLEKLKKLIDGNKIDFPLLLVYARLKKSM